MSLDEQDLRNIYAQAASLDERIGCVAAGTAGTGDCSLSEQARLRLEFWETIFARTGGITLEARLEAEGWSRSLVSGALEDGPVPALDCRELPSWGSLLAAVSAEAARLATKSTPRSVANLNGVPFWPLLEPFVNVAESTLVHNFDGSSDVRLALSENIQQLTSGLVHRLTWLSWRPLFAEFSAARPREVLLRAVLSTSGDQKPPAEFFDDWCNTQLADGLRRILLRYPVLGRLAATTIEDWCEASREMVERFFGDWPAFAVDHLGIIPKIVGVTTHLSDPHSGGRAVASITLSSKQMLYYKPRPMELEQAFNDFLRCLNESDAPLKLGSLRIISRPEYGWAESVCPVPCGDEAGIRQFYEEAGALLCVLDVLGAADAHCENVIASGPHPILVDAETVMHPDAPRPEWMVTPLLTQLSNSVLRTGLLPRWDFSLNNQHPLTMSGLWTGETSSMESPTLEWPNSDLQSIGTRIWEEPTPQNAPHVGEQRYPCMDFVPELMAGYRNMHRFFQRCGRRIADSLEFQRLSGLVTRYVFRRTVSYAQALELSNDPAALKAGVDRSLILELLVSGFATDRDSVDKWWIHKAERKALWRLDIPHFETRTDTSVMHGPNPEDKAELHCPSYQSAQYRLLTMDEDDLDLQLSLIKQVLTPRIAETREVAEHKYPRRRQKNQHRPMADEIVREMVERSLGDPFNDIAWIGIKYDLIHRSRSFHAIGPGLYDGLVGVGLLLASYLHAGGEIAVRDALDRILLNLSGLRGRLERLEVEQLRGALGLGLGAGAAGLIYGLVCVGELADRADAVELALGYARLAQPLIETAPSSGDLLSGLPGLAMALMAVAETTGEPAIRLQVQEIARRVLSDVTVRMLSGRALDDLSDASFAHGTSGLLSSLMRLHLRLEDDRLAGPVRSGMPLMERQLAEWIRRAPAEGTASDYSWCNGVVGIGSGLAEWARWLQITGEDHATPAAALKGLAGHLAQRLPHSGKDVLCCGNWGAVEMLTDAAATLKSDQLRRTALKLAASLLAKHAANGRWTALADTPLGVFNPGLFQGYAGIALAILRLDEPTAGTPVLRFA